mgnify:FL=1
MGKFTDRFIEETEDEPVNGRCFVHLSDHCFSYVMNVNMVDGKREGIAIISLKGKKHWKLEYRNGELNGMVERYCRNGRVVLRGHCRNGVEVGLFKEYGLDGNIVWRGYYRNGERYSKVIKSVTRIGFYEERRVSDNQLLSIAEYDEALKDKNGHCIEYDDGGVYTQWLYKNGVKIRPIYGSGIATMTDQNGNGESVEEGEGMLWETENSPVLVMENATSFVVYDIEKGHLHGIVNRNEKVYQVEIEATKKDMIEFDLISETIRVFEGNGWKTITEDEKGCIDLDTNGRRWEGGVWNGKMFGYGELYDEEGNKEYEGFMMKGMRIGFGREFYPDIDCVKYSGAYYKDRKCGYGVLYNRRGEVDYEGWWEDEVMEVNNDVNVITNHTDRLIVPDQSFNTVNWFSLSSLFLLLKEIIIGNSCFQYCIHFVVEGLNALERIQIGEWCFSYNSRWNEVRDSKSSQGVCRIRKCPKLKSIRSGDYSFSNYHSLELENLPSLETLEFGEKCCYASPEFILAGRDDERIRIRRFPQTSVFEAWF